MLYIYKKKHTIYFLFFILFFCNIYGCVSKKEIKLNNNLEMAEKTLNSLYQKYSIQGTCFLHENYPQDSTYSASYLNSDDNHNSYSYLWPYSGTLSAINVLLCTTHKSKYKKLLDKKVIPGLEGYFDTSRFPYAYSSYIHSASKSDRFYDDNIWIGIDFTDLFLSTKNITYLDKSKMIWRFIESGIDDKLGGGIYWCEQKKESKNTCTNAPASVYALKLFIATQDSSYLFQGKKLYEWTKSHLQDSSDYLYFDNIRLNGKIGKEKYAYNSGQMMQSAALLYKLTRNKIYLVDAQNIAKSCYSYFFNDFTPTVGNSFKLLRKGDVWFYAVMLRGFIELYQIDKNKTYINAFNKSLHYAWEHDRDSNGLFNVDLSGINKDDRKWLLTQAAMVEMYGRLTTFE